MAQARDAMKAGTYVRALDGLRGLAVLIVLIYHGSFGHFPGGFLGVDVFFVLSGYLITKILLGELNAAARIDWTGFYARRAGRLFPALAVALVFFAVSWPFLPDAVPFQWAAVPTLLYYANWTFAYGAWRLGPMQHAWSLSVEEQFYAVWPLCLAIVWRRRVSPGVLVAGIVAFAATRGILYAAASPLGSYASTIARADQLLVGALAACVSFGSPAFLRGAAWLAVGVLGIACWTVDYHHAWLYYGGFTIVALLAACTIQHLADPDTPSLLKQLFEGRAIVTTGRISYGMYLFHPAVFSLLFPLGRAHSISSRAAVLVLQIAATFAAAWLSYRLIERPALQRVRVWAASRHTRSSDAGTATQSAGIQVS